MSYEMQIWKSATAETRMAVHTHLAGCFTPLYPARNIGFLFQITNILIEGAYKFDVKENNFVVKENNFTAKACNFTIKENDFATKENNFIAKESNFTIKENDFAAKENNFPVEEYYKSNKIK